MDDRLTGSQKASRTGPVALGIAAVAVLCCAALPLLAGLLAGVAVGRVLGVGVGVLAVLVVVALIVARLRRGRAGGPSAAVSDRGGES